jgi:hypothetical protein
MERPLMLKEPSPSPRDDHSAAAHYFGRGRSFSSDALDGILSTTHTDKFVMEEQCNRPTPHVELLGGRFVMTVVAGVGAVVAILAAIRFTSFTIERDVADPIGSSANANARVSFYQTVNGFLWTGLGLLLEQYFRLFLAVVVIFFRNSKWFPGDEPSTGHLPKYKRLMLFGVTPLAMYVVNIGLTSVFIEHRVTDVRHAFVDEDLMVATALSQTRSGVMAATAARHSTSIRDTVLRTAVRGDAVPFKINEHAKCGTTNLTTDRTIRPPTAAVVGSGIPSESTSEPSIMDVEGTSVAFAFPVHAWYEAALPTSLTATHTITFAGGTPVDPREEARFSTLLREANIELETIFELLVQGLTLYDKAESDSNAWVDYPCTWVDHKEDAAYDALVGNPLSTRRQLKSKGLHDRRASAVAGSTVSPGGEENKANVVASNQTDPVFSIYPRGSDYAGLRKCFGAQSSLRTDLDLTQSSSRNLSSLIALADFMGFENMTDVSIRIEIFALSPQMNITSLTIDYPFSNDTGYRIDIDKANCKNGVFKAGSPLLRKKTSFSSAQQWEQYQAEVCDPRYISFANASELCGPTNCIFKDESDIVSIKKEFTMTPYMKHCDMTKLSYSFDVNSWFPSGCVPQNDSAMLYGLGSYVAGDFDANRQSVRFPRERPSPVLANARRHYVLSAAKLAWQFEDVSKRFGAKCGVAGGCDGIIHRLEKVPTDSTANSKAKVLVVGRDYLKNDFRNHSLANPLVLLSLNTPKFYYGNNDPENRTYYIWERIGLEDLNTTYSESQGLGLTKDQCSLLIETYLQQQNVNHYFIKDPLFPLYASALFYLLQDAAVKEVDLPEANTLGVVDLSNPVIGFARMKGDVERKEIRYSISLVSAIATSLGVTILLLYLAMMLQWPRDAVKLSDERLFAAQYADVLSDDRYLKSVHERQLKLPTDDVVAMDDYVVESIVFQHPLEPGQKVLL